MKKIFVALQNRTSFSNDVWNEKNFSNWSSNLHPTMSAQSG